MNESANYIQQVPSGHAGKLTIEEQEKYPTVRRRLVVAAQAVHIPLIIKRSGNDVYFWREGTEEEQPRRKRKYTRRRRMDEETTAPEQPMSERADGEHGVPAEASPE